MFLDSSLQGEVVLILFGLQRSVPQNKTVRENSAPKRFLYSICFQLKTYNLKLIPFPGPAATPLFLENGAGFGEVGVKGFDDVAVFFFDDAALELEREREAAVGERKIIGE